ncbi:MAG: cytochrome-c peroxidase [Bryobacterales bacterium]|nr:cytochrome-c peroxidase [Bryobacterales bacterium]
MGKLTGTLLAAALFVPLSSADTVKVPKGLMPLVWPADNPYTPAKAYLGRLLYFDKRLSADASVSCATCHDPKHAFTDAAPVSTGIRGQKGNRSAPTVINRAYSLAQFWDGRASTLEEQAIGPMANSIEMGNSHDIVVSTLRSIRGYGPLFAKAFGTDEITLDQVAKSIATFERTVLSGDAPYDRYKAGDKSAMTPQQVRGMGIYFDRAKCDQCHEGINFTSNMFANLGVGTDKPDPDPGRYAVTKNPKDWGSFKTPTLREIEHTAPYMHNGSLATLMDVVDYYDKGGIPNRNLDPRIKKLNLTQQDKEDLVAFLKALSGSGWQHIRAPEIFPQ